MSCKCDEMRLLKDQMDKLTPILEESERFFSIQGSGN